MRVNGPGGEASELLIGGGRRFSEYCLAESENMWACPCPGRSSNGVDSTSSWLLAGE
jgi:hypothetical protein